MNNDSTNQQFVLHYHPWSKRRGNSSGALCLSACLSVCDVSVYSASRRREINRKWQPSTELLHAQNVNAQRWHFITTRSTEIWLQCFVYFRCLFSALLASQRSSARNLLSPYPPLDNIRVMHGDCLEVLHRLSNKLYFILAIDIESYCDFLASHSVSEAHSVLVGERVTWWTDEASCWIKDQSV